MFKAFGLLLLVALASARVPVDEASYDAISGEYLIQLHANVTDAAHSDLASRFGGKKYSIGPDYRAMFAKLSNEELEWVQNQDHLVKIIAQNAVVRAVQTCIGQGEPVSWGQVRTTAQSPADVNQIYAHVDAWGTGVDAYVLDTGIDCAHEEFTGRCTVGANFAGGGDTDLNGHGTHCAGTIGGTTYGIAKSTHLISVKVLGDSGSGSWSGLIEGLEWTAQEMSRSGRPTIASLSLGGGGNAPGDNAADAAQNAGVNVVIAAGNNNGNACNFSPARAPMPTAVGSTELGTSGGVPRDVKSSFSNHGLCVDVFAPGSAIISAYRGGYATLSGTSMACPHVAGAMSVYLTANPGAGSEATKQFIIDSSMSTDIMNRGTSPDRMLHVQC